jgi:amidase/aspartyl-tRNA(Asn)/glutamyl-tRNA(Gln) amidotransferase subunit A
MQDNDLAWRSAAEQARAIRSRRLSPVEAMEACIGRIEARNPSLGALVFTAFDEARARAKDAERAVMAGDDLGPLHGVPTALKDLFDFSPGWPATLGGIRALRDFRPDWRCLFAERIEKAGAILVGKTNSPVLGFRGTCDNYLFGPARNPFDTSRNAGGSSGGAAAAVADGLLPLAEGTDGGGSIRIPSSWCGVYGFKPSAGRVPVVARPNAFLGAAPFIHEGPIARTVEDAALAMTVLAGWDARDPHAVEGEVDFMGAVDRPVAGWRIGYSPDFGGFAVEPRVREAVGRAVAAFAEAGAIVEESTFRLPAPQLELSQLWCRLIMPLSVTALDSFKAMGIDLLGEHRADLPPRLIDWLERSYRQSAVELFRDLELRTRVYDAVQAEMERFDLLVTPTLGCLPVLNASDGDTIGPMEIEGQEVDPLIGWCLTYPLNFTGHPAASVPAGLVDGLPVGMQLIGHRYGDAQVISASAAFERLRPWAATYAIPAGRAM